MCQRNTQNMIIISLMQIWWVEFYYLALRNVCTPLYQWDIWFFCYLHCVSRERYKSYIKHTKKVFTADIEESYRSVERSKWLAGPDFLHKTVKNFRDLDGQSTKPFMEWLGIQQSLTQISGGMGCHFCRDRGKLSLFRKCMQEWPYSWREAWYSYIYVFFENWTVISHAC
jgi:hypothetical protein